VVRRGWHVDIGIAVADMQTALLPVAQAFPDARYLLFGFGDRRYLLHGGAANMAAALWGGAGLILVTRVDRQQPEDVFGADNVVRFELTTQQMSDLQSFLRGSLTLREGTPVPVKPDPHGSSSFGGYYESELHYSALHTCNSWAAQALQAAGLPVSSSGVEFAGQLWRQIQQLKGESSRAAAPSGFLVTPATARQL
jgi:hypothetical protein